jgi:hypothetical protein
VGIIGISVLTKIAALVPKPFEFIAAAKKN